MQEALAKRRELLGPAEPGRGAEPEQPRRSALRASPTTTEAERELRQALADPPQAAGQPQRAEVADTLSELAEVMSYRGEYAQGQPLIEEALAIRRRLYGDEHPLVAESIARPRARTSAIAATSRRPRTTCARRMDCSASCIRRAHPALAEAINNVAWALMNQDQPERSRAAVSRGASRCSASCCGDAHPDLARGAATTWASRVSVAAIFAGAEAAYLEALQMNRKLLGERHPEVANDDEQPRVRHLCAGTTPGSDRPAARVAGHATRPARQRASRRGRCRCEPCVLARGCRITRRGRNSSSTRALPRGGACSAMITRASARR